MDAQGIAYAIVAVGMMVGLIGGWWIDHRPDHNDGVDA